MQHVTLPDGRQVWAVSRLEALVVYREIVAERTYERHGITLPAGARVFDVGANLGMFTMHLAATVPGVHVRAFEPVAATYALLRRNLDERAPGAVPVNAALGAEAGVATFDVDRFSSIDTSMARSSMTGAAVATAGVSDWIAASVADLARVDPGPLPRALAGSMRRPWARPFVVVTLAAAWAALELRKRLFLRRQSCAVRTVSAELAACGFDTLDLVKIDVEGAEEEVLRGISDADWPRIRQLVIEVHDVDGRRDRMAAGLIRRGYAVTHDREDWAIHPLLGISTIYAIRR